MPSGCRGGWKGRTAGALAGRAAEELVDDDVATGEQPLSLGGDGTSPATRELVETETRRILDEGHEQALETLKANRHRLDALVEALLHAETLDAADAYRAAGVPVPAQPELPAESISG